MRRCSYLGQRKFGFQTPTTRFYFAVLRCALTDSGFMADPQAKNQMSVRNPESVRSHRTAFVYLCYSPPPISQMTHMRSMLGIQSTEINV